MAEIDSIFSKEVEEQAIRLGKLFQDIDKYINNIKTSGGGAADSMKSYAQAQKMVEEGSKELVALKKKEAAETEKQNKANERAAAKAKEYADAIATEAKTLEQLTKQNKALVDARNKVDTTTKEGAKRIKEINAQLDENNKKIKENSSNLEKQKINVGNYISSWGPFQGIATMVTRGIGIMKIAFASLKAAIISTGIGALVIALISLFTYFQKTERGAEALKKILAGFQAVIKVLIDRVIAFGEGLFKIFSGDFASGLEKIKGTFVGITAEIKEEYNLARKLAEELENIHDFNRAAEVEQERLNLLKQRELEIARDSEQPINARLEAWQKATKFTKEGLAITKAANDLEMANLKARIEMGENSEEVMDNIAKLQAKMYQDEANAQQSINALFKLGNGLRAKAADEAERLRRATDQVSGMESLAPLIQIEETKTQVTLDGIALRTEAQEAAHARMLEMFEEERQAMFDTRVKAAQEYTAAAAEIGQSLFDFNQMLLDFEVQDMEQKKAYELQLAGDNADKRAAIEKKYDEEARKLKIKQAKQDKAQAIFTAIIKTAQAVLAGLAYGPPLGYVFAALNAVLGAVQIGVISSQPIPQFAKGTKRAPGGLALVGERGRELIAGPGGLALSPGTASLVNLGKGGQRIYNNRETEMILRAARGADDSGSKRLLDQIHNDNRELINVIKNKSELHISGNGSRITERKGNYARTYLDKKVNW